MKCVKLAAILAFTLAGSHSAMALDIQPGEWVTDHNGKKKVTCYDAAAIKHLKEMKKGKKIKAGKCVTDIKDNSSTHQNTETYCKTPDKEFLIATDMTKTSETEVKIKVKMDITLDGKTSSAEEVMVQKFVSAQCTAPSNSKAK